MSSTGKHVGAQFVEDEEHLRGPAADSVHVDEPFDQGLVGEAGPFRRVERAGHEMAREIAHVGGLALGEAAAAQRRQPGAAEACRVEPRRRAGAASRDHHPVPDRLRGLDRDLLPDDRPRERGEGIAAALEVNAGMAPDHAFQNGVPPAELARGVIPIGGLHRRARVRSPRSARVNAGAHRGIVEAGLCRSVIGAAGRAQRRFCARGMANGENGRVSGFLLREGAHGCQEVADRKGPAHRRSRPRRAVPPRFAGRVRHRRSEEDPPHRLSHGGNGIRSGPRLGPLLEHHQRGDLRAPADVRLSRAPREARADGRRRRCRK